jgi:hypothetical protein
MAAPVFHVIETPEGAGVTYDCGCPCTPTASITQDRPGSEHCCCGKVHFAGKGAPEALTAYLADRAATKKREPEYERGTTEIETPLGQVPVAWAFPR